MGRFLVLSSGGHLFLLAAWLISSSLLSKPRMSYYAVDLASSLPSGGSPAVAPAPTPVEAPKVPPPPPVPETRRLPPKEVIKVPGKVKKPVPPKAQKKHGVNLKAALAVLDSTEKKQARPGIVSSASSSSMQVETGEAFPYPWYTKAVRDKLDEHWKPQRDFSEDLVCQVDFVIHRNGHTSDIKVAQSSGDSTFDLFGQRAVMYSDPFPPLPPGYQEETLHVHMKFQGNP